MAARRVLIVEDDPDVREFMDLLVSTAGYDTDTAGNGAEALGRMRAQRPCVVLLDLQMPVMDGFQFRARQLADSVLASVPVVCLTAAFDLQATSEQLGVPCLGKPIDVSSVFKHIADACRGAATMSKKDFGAVSRRLGEAAAEMAGAEDGARRSAHLESVQAQIDAIARGDLTAALANAHPNLELEIFAPPEFPWVRKATGLEQIGAAIAHNFEAVDQQSPTIQNVVTQGDTVVLFGHESGIIRATGTVYDVQFVQRFTFVDGRLRSVRIVAARTDPTG